MNRLFILSLLATIYAILPSCADHDDPQLYPIDTTQVRISATVRTSPDTKWLNKTEELTVSVSDVEMTAPKGVVLRSIALIANDGRMQYKVGEKPFSGEPLEFKVPLNYTQGRINYSLIGNLIKKDCRDAEFIITDNIQKIVFSEEPQFECEGWLYVSVKSRSTTGEEHNNSFEVRSADRFTIAVPQSELYWTPSSGTAHDIEISIGGGATAWSPNTTFDCKITHTSIGHSTADPATIKVTIPNTPGALTSEKLQFLVTTTYYGTWENITIDPYNLTSIFTITETE